MALPHRLLIATVQFMDVSSTFSNLLGRHVLGHAFACELTVRITGKARYYATVRCYSRRRDIDTEKRELYSF